PRTRPAPLVAARAAPHRRRRRARTRRSRCVAEVFDKSCQPRRNPRTRVSSPSMRNSMGRGLVLVFAALTAVAVAQQPPAPLVRENATVKLTDHVWAIPDFNVGLVPNVGIIVGSTATLVVDTGLGPTNGETIAREVKKVSKNADVFVVLTHYHPEHS